MNNKKIKLKGKYTGANKRGITIGGVPFMPGLPSKMINVDEDTYLRLKAGVKNGWFEIDQDDYKDFLVEKKEEETNQEVEKETKIEEENEAKVKKTSSSKKASKKSEETADKIEDSEEVKDSSK